MSAIPVAPGRWPLFGHLPSLARSPLRFIRTVRQLGDVVAVYLGGTKAYLVNSPELIRQVLVGNVHRFDKGLEYEKLGGLLGNALATSSGVPHRDRRRMIQPAFHHQHIAGYEALMREATTALINTWQAGKVVAVDQAMRELALTIVAKAMCSTELGANAIATIQRDLPRVMSGVAWRVLSPIPALERLPIPANQRFDGANKRLRAVVSTLITKYRKTGAEHGDLLSMLLHARDPETGTALNDKQIQDEVVNLLFAGTETTGSAMAWAWYELSRNPEIEKQLRAEAESGENELAMRVCKESLRIHPPAWLMSRRVREPIWFGEHQIPVGTIVLFSPYAVQRDPKVYRNPAQFDPDRWLPERAAENPRHAFLAFGAGPHNCIGEGFALLEMTTVLSTIASRFRLVQADSTVEKVTATLVPNRLNMRVVSVQKSAETVRDKIRSR